MLFLFSQILLFGVEVSGGLDAQILIPSDSYLWFMENALSLLDVKIYTFLWRNLKIDKECSKCMTGGPRPKRNKGLEHITSVT